MNKLETIQSRIVALEAEALKLALRPTDDFAHGDVIMFTKSYGNHNTEYTFIALKVLSDKWYMTGKANTGWHSWDVLMEFAFSHGDEPSFHYVTEWTEL